MTSLLPNGLASSAHAENHAVEEAVASISQRRGPDSDDVSQALGEKMLQGWTLLGDTCPRCSTILVRNRDRELYCVACQLFVRSAPPAAAPTAQEQAQDPVVPTEPATGPSTQPQQQPQPQPPQQIHTQAWPNGDAVLARRQETVKQQLCHSLLGKAAQINEQLASVNCNACIELLHSLMTVCDAYAKVQSCL